MSNKKYKLAVYIGRFQPFHNGHRKVIEEGLEIADSVLVLLGSFNTPRTIKNPFTKFERKKMISCFFNDNISHDASHRVYIRPISDYTYDENKWIEQIQTKVKLFSVSDKEIVLLGFKRDDSSYYLNYFPNWHTYFSAEHHHYNEPINGTALRDAYFSNPAEFFSSYYVDMLPSTTIEVMKEFARKEEFKQLQNEWKYVQNYKDMWSSAPYPPTFVTADAVVIQSGHILLVQRKYEPGKGLWALPGGFVAPNEKIFDCAVRELIEETNIKVPEKVLRASCTFNQVFDSPFRSDRGRTITHAFLFELKDNEKLPKVKAADDAEDAKWFSFSELESMAWKMFEDHFHILYHMRKRHKIK